MDHNKQGLTLLDKGEASAALIAFTKALIEHPTSPDYFCNRSKAFTRLSPPRHDLALQDAEYAILYARQRGKRDKIQDGQVRRVVALYSTGQYAAADRLIDIIGAGEEAKLLKIWKVKVTQKLAALPEGERGDAGIEEIPKIKAPSAEEGKKLLQKQLKSDGTFNFDAAEGKTDNSAQEAVNEENSIVQQQAKPAVAVTVRQDWFQTPTTVTITLFAKGVDKDKFKCDLKQDSLHITFPNPGNTAAEYSYSVDSFYGGIDVSKSKATVLKTKVEVVLHKATPGHKWSALEGTEKPTTIPSTSTSQFTATALTPKETAPAYPTSSRKGAKDWDKVAADLTTTKKQSKPVKKTDSDGSASSAGEEEDAVGSDDEGGDDVDNFFKKLYKGSDPDTQRAMMKSFYESGGTTLSTNWSEVGSKRVEPYESKESDD